MLSVEKSLIPDVTTKVASAANAVVTSTPWETSLGLAVPSPAVLTASSVQPVSLVHEVSNSQAKVQSQSDTEVSTGVPSDSNSTYPVTTVDSVGQSHLSSSAGSNESSPTQPKLEPKDDILKQEEPPAPHSSIYQVN